MCTPPSPSHLPLLRKHTITPPPPRNQVQNEDPTHERLQLFNRLWASHFAGDSLLVFSTGRSPALFAELWVRVGPFCVCVFACLQEMAATQQGL